MSEREKPREWELTRENYVWHVRLVSEIGIEKNSDPVRVLEAEPVERELAELRHAVSEAERINEFDIRVANEELREDLEKLRGMLADIEKMTTGCGGLTWSKALERLTSVKHRARDAIAEVRKSDKPAGLLESEATRPLRINGLKAVDFIRRAFDLGDDCMGPGRFDLDDRVQRELRHIEAWIKMAQSDALDARRGISKDAPDEVSK